MPLRKKLCRVPAATGVSAEFQHSSRLKARLPSAILVFDTSVPAMSFIAQGGVQVSWPDVSAVGVARTEQKPWGYMGVFVSRTLLPGVYTKVR